MSIPTEPIGSIPRPPELLEGLKLQGSADPRLEQGSSDLVPDGFRLTLVSHTRNGPGRTSGVLRYRRSAEPCLATAKRFAYVPVTPELIPVPALQEVGDGVLQAAELTPRAQLGASDDRGFSPSWDDTSTSRETALAEIRARVLGTAVAAERIGAC